MSREDNLKPDALKKIPPEQRRENGRKGGIKSGEVRRRNRQIKDTLQLLMDSTIKKGKGVSTEKIKDLSKVHDMNLTTEQAMVLAMINKAMNGDVSAFIAIRDTLGEKPTDKVEVSNEVVILDDDI